MNISVEQLPSCRANVRTEVPADRVKKERAKIIGYYSQQAKLPGFRPGKVPANVIEKKFGKEIEGAIMEGLVQDALREAGENHDLKVIDVGEIKDKTYGADEALTFVLDVTTAPTFEIPNYEGLSVRVPIIEVTEEQVDNVIKDACQQYTDYEDVEGKALEMGDVAVVDYEGTVDGTPLAEFDENIGTYLASGKDQWIKLEDQGFLPGFAEGLVGAKAGDKKDISIVLEEEFPVEAIAGMEVLYQTEIKGVKNTVVPEFDDELANKIEEGATAESLKERVRDNIKQQSERNVQTHKINEVVRQVTEGPDFELPESILLAETQDRVNQMASEAQQRGATDDTLQENEEAIITQAGQQAEFNVRSAFILDKIAEKEEVEITDEELSRAVASVAQQENKPIKKAVAEMKKSGTIRKIQHDLRIQKAIELLIEKANIEEIPAKEWEAEMQAKQDEAEAQAKAQQNAQAAATAEGSPESPESDSAEPKG